MAGKIYKKMTLPAETSRLAEVRRIVEEAACAASFEVRMAHLIALAVDEAVTNVVKHSYKNIEPGMETVELLIESDENSLAVTVRDTGESFDPVKVSPVTDMREHVRCGKKSGLGIFIMRRIMDEVSYSFRRGELNELRMVKYIDRSKTKAKNGSA